MPVLEEDRVLGMEGLMDLFFEISRTILESTDYEPP
jgi:hypothetical protein